MRAGKDTQISEINITPLTDIFLVLLVIMMVVTPMLDLSGLGLTVLQTDAPPEDREIKAIRLEVTGANAFSLDGALIPGEALTRTLREQSMSHPDGLFIEVDPESSHEALAVALGAARRAGLASVSVSLRAAAPPTEPASAPPGR
jgi:biopolymer transport protein ExbD